MKYKLLFIAILFSAVSWGQSSIAALATNYTQDFNSLTTVLHPTATTWADNTTLTGWYARTTGGTGVTISNYYGNTGGTTTTGGLYSFGVAGTNAVTDRALGFINSNGFTGATGSGKGYYGWRLKNNTGSTLTSITVTWTGEQWKKTNILTTQNIILQYQTGATVSDLVAGSWTAAPSTFTSPMADNVAATLDGNAPANRTANISVTITVSIAAGNEIMLRWEDLNDSGNDHYLAIDDVTVNASNANKVSASSGDWNTAATWNPVGVPVAGDNVIIQTGHIVSTSIAITPRTGTTTVNGSFQLNSGGWASGIDFIYNATTGGLIFNTTYTANSGCYWPATSSPVNVTVNTACPLTLGFARTVSGVFQTFADVANPGNLTINGTLLLNAGYTFSGAGSPIYGASSLLKYNSGGTPGRGAEWVASSGTIGTTAGYPNNVQISGSTNLNFPNGSTSTFKANGSLTIDAFSFLSQNFGGGSAALIVGTDFILNGGITLGAATSGDITVGGNWTRASTASFTPNGRAVFFNGTTTQNLTVSPSGTETFNFLIVQGSGTLKPATGTLVVVNSSSGLTLSSTNAISTIDLNGQTLTLSGGGNLDLSGGARNITSTGGASSIIITNNNLTVTSSAGGSLTTASNIVVNLQRGLDCGAGSLVTINGTLQINANGFCTGNSPRYGAASLLQYNNGTSYNRQLEWTSTTAAIGGVGAPNNVQVSSNTTFNYYNATNSGPKSIVGNLVVDAGSTFSMGSVSTGGAVTVPGNVTVAGALSLCNSSPILGDDLRMGGNLAFTGGGSLAGNERAIVFTKTGIQTVSSALPLTIPFVVTAGTGTTVQLLSSITISSSLTGLNVLTFGNAADVIDINGQTLTIGTNLYSGVISGSGSFKGSATSNLTLNGTGNIGTVKFGPLVADMNLGTFVMNRTATGGCSMGSNLTINAASATALTLTAGTIDLGANTMTIASGTALTGGSSTSYVIADKTAGGVFSVGVTVNGAAYKFPIGDRAASNAGSEYSPCTVTFTTTTFTTAFLNVSVEDSKEPNLDATTVFISRYWDITKSGTFGSIKYAFSGTYIASASDVNGAGAPRGNQWNGTTWLNNGNAAVSPIFTIPTLTTLPTTNRCTAGLRDVEINIVKGLTTYLTGSTYDFTPVTAQNVGAPLVVTFTVQNTGQGTNVLTTTSALSGTSYATNYINPTSVLGGTGTNTYNFTVTFTPLTAGTFTGSISIANNDTTGSENPYVIYFTAEAVCSPAAVNTITPTSGPVGTEVTITATNATDFTGGAIVTFLGTVATSTTTTGTTIIKAIVPNTVINGQGTLTTVNTTGCLASNSFTVDRNVTNTCQGGANLSDLIISEVTDATYGGLTYVEIYNGTGAAVDLTANAYSLQFFANGSATSTTQALTGTIANGTTYTVSTALSGSSCAVPGGDGLAPYANLISAVAGINFADSATGNTSLGHDHIGLYKGAVKKDSWGVYGDQTWASSLNIGDRGADFRRKNNVTLPNPTYSNLDWDIINWSGTGSSSCSNNDYSNIGAFNFLAGTPPNVTIHPTYTPTCKTASLTVAGTEGYAGGNPLTYQWYAVAPGVATWTALTNGALYSGVTAATLNLLNTSTLSGYQFYCMINENTTTCHAASNAIKIVPSTTATWNGSGWVGASPSLNNAVIINGNYDTSAIGNDSFEACSVTVNAPNVLTITDGKYVSIQNDLTVIAPGNVIVQDNGSLVQIDDSGVNTGTVDVQRIATAKLSDYVYWSSPVSSFPAASVSPTTSSSLIWKWNPTVANSNNGQGSWQSAAADIMAVGKGYIIRAPNSFNNVTAADFTANFTGTPFNGIKQPSIARGNITTVLGTYPAAPYAGTNGAIITEYKDNMNLVGNPFPSSINAINFLTFNTNILGYINLWTHGSSPSISSSPYYGNYAYNYAPGDYITYNVSGASTGPSAFSGYVASGQGFFVTMNDGAADASQTVTFKNAMRSNYSAGNYTYFDNSNFYRNAANHHNTLVSQAIERNRIWLDLIGETGTATRTLVGYIEGATMEMDRLFDANISIGASQNLFSLISDKPYNIQGRALPFDPNDTVRLGVNLPTSGTFTIAIATTDGLFQETNQGIYLEDTALNIIHDLRVAPYVFTAESGRLDSRFVLRYTTDAALGTIDFDTINSSVVVATPNHNQIAIKSYIEDMKSVVVYDILGRLVYTNNEVNAKDLTISNAVLNQQALIVKITLENGLVVTKKIVL